MTEKSGNEKNKLNVYDDDEAYILNDDHSADYQLEENHEINDYNEHNQGNSNELKDFEDDSQNNHNELRENNNLLTNSNEELNSQFKENTTNLNINNPNLKLITLKYVSVCQCCKQNFNSGQNIPYLLKCGHFFCKVCIMKNFYDQESKMILCPEDGPVAKSLSELKLLKNLIVDMTDRSETYENEDKDEKNEADPAANNCPLHANQKISYFIENTNELICVYCAFNKYKSSPRLEIKELPEKCTEIIKDLTEIIKDNQQYTDALQNSYAELNRIREDEESKIKAFFDKLTYCIEEKRNKLLKELSNYFNEDSKTFTEKIEQSSKKIEIAETIKFSLAEVLENKGIEIASVFDAYFEFNANYMDKYDLSANTKEYKFTYDYDQNKLFKLIDDYSVIKTKIKPVSYNSRSNEALFSKKNYVPKSKNANWNCYSSGIVNTSHNDYNNVLNTEDYFGEKNVPSRSYQNSSQEAANRIGRNEVKKDFDYSRLKKELNYNNNFHSNNTFYTSHANQVINPMMSVDYSKSKSKESSNNFIQTTHSHQQYDMNNRNYLTSQSGSRSTKERLNSEKIKTPDMIIKHEYLK